MELDELHVDQLGPGVVGERVAVAGVFPRIARDLVRLADAAGRQDDRLRPEDGPAAAFAIVGQRSGNAAAVEQELDDRPLHVHADALVNAVILQRADQFEAGAVADVGQPRILVAAEVALQDSAVLGAIENGSPGFQFANALGGFLGVQARPSASC